jgi:hypothetical protein
LAINLNINISKRNWRQLMQAERFKAVLLTVLLIFSLSVPLMFLGGSSSEVYASPAGGSDNKIQVKVKVFVLQGVGSPTDNDIDDRIDEANESLKSSGIELVRGPIHRGVPGNAGNYDNRENLRKWVRENMKKENFKGVALIIVPENNINHDSNTWGISVKGDTASAMTAKTGENMGKKVWMHEIAHVLCLQHIDNENNIMNGTNSCKEKDFSPEQIENMKKKAENLGVAMTENNDNMIPSTTEIDNVEDTENKISGEPVPGYTHVDLYYGGNRFTPDGSKIIFTGARVGLFPRGGLLEQFYYADIGIDIDNNPATGEEYGDLPGVDVLIYVDLFGSFPFESTITIDNDPWGGPLDIIPVDEDVRIYTAIETTKLQSPGEEIHENVRDIVEVPVPVDNLGSVVNGAPAVLLSIDPYELVIDKLYFNVQMEPPTAPWLSASSPAGAVGETIQLEGGDFPADSFFDVFCSLSLGGTRVEVAQTTLDEYGNFSTSFEVPDLPPDDYYLTAIDEEGNSVFLMFTVRDYFIKECMPDLGQHCVNWCWTAAAANSIYWWSQHGYPELIDDPTDLIPNDNRYITDPLIPHPPPPPCPGVYRLLHEIATDCLYPGMPENEVTIENTWCQPMINAPYFYGLQEFIDEQGAPLIVHEIVDNDLFWQPDLPPEDGSRVIYRPPTLVDYQRELERCQDVLLWLNFRHEYPYEDTDHVVTGVGFGYDNTWILVSDPWTPGAPDHGNDLYHENDPYDNLPVISAPESPLWVIYAGVPVQVAKMVYISPCECGVDVTIEPKHKRGAPCMWLTFVVSVHNTGNCVDNYNLWVEPDGWPMENIILEDNLLLNIQPCETGTTFLYVHIPEDALPCTHKEIVVVADSECCDATDNDNALVQVVSKYLHNIEPGFPLDPDDNWVCWTLWHEIYPEYCNYYHLHSWEDNNMDNMISPCDRIDLQNLDNENDITWYHIKDITITLAVEPDPGMPPEFWMYLEFEDGFEDYWRPIYEPVCTQWNEILPMFCNRYHLAAWDDMGEPYGELSYCDWVLLVDKVTGEGVWWHVANVATDLVLCEEPPWTGWATFELENMYKVSVDKNLKLYAGSKLVMKFYKYDNITLQAQSVIDNWSVLPHLVIAKENVPHPLGTPVPPSKFPTGTVQIAKLILTEANPANEISEIASFTVHQSDLRNRYIEILIDWAGYPAKQPAFRAEIIDILLQWASAPP